LVAGIPNTGLGPAGQPKDPKGNHNMKSSEVISRIRSLHITRQAKADLVLLYTRARKLVVGILRFLERHKHLGESLVLGALAAWMLMHVPVIGAFLGLCAMVTAAAIGLMRELREDIQQLFAIA